jgi:hypothetical protein
VFDIETKGLGGEFIQALVMWYAKDGTQELRWCNSAENLILTLTSRQLRGMIGYAHNGAGYDFKYLLDAESLILPQGWQYHPISTAMTDIGMKLVRNKEVVELHDFYKIAPAKLEKLTEMFDVRHKKLIGAIDFETEQYNPKNPKHREYLLHDCLGYYEVIEAFTKIWTEHFGTPLGWTTPASAMKAWKAKIPEGHVYFRMHSEYRDYFRECYYGGYNYPGYNSWKQTGDETLIGWDVNSMYPAMMLQGVPVGQPTHTTKYISGLPGFYSIHAIVPDDTPMPILPYTNVKAQRFFPTGEFDTKCTSVEIDRARELGYTITVKEGYFFQKTEKIFDEIIKICMEIRLNPKYQGTVIEYIAKLVQNALYGKFGSSEWNTKYIVSEAMPDGDDWMNAVDIFTGEILEKVWQRFEEVDVPYLHPEWAAWITALARVTLSQLAEQFAQRGKLVYIDTDSVKALVKPSDNIAVDEDPHRYGAWKRELEADEWYCAGPKTYTYHDIHTDEWVVHSKGVPQKLVTSDMIRRASQGEKVEIEFTTMPSLSFLIKHDERIQPARKEKRALTTPSNVMNWRLEAGIFRPIKIDEVEELRQLEMLYMEAEQKRYQTEERTVQKKLWMEIRKMGGIRPSADWPDVPRHLRRKTGFGLDIIAEDLGYESTNDLYEILRKKF